MDFAIDARFADAAGNRVGTVEQAFELEPNTGVSRFYYANHGTTNEVEARLVELLARSSRGDEAAGQRPSCHSGSSGASPQAWKWNRS